MVDAPPMGINVSENSNITIFPPIVPLQDINLNGRYGYLVAAKGATQFVCNPFVGIIVSKYVFPVYRQFAHTVTVTLSQKKITWVNSEVF